VQELRSFNPIKKYHLYLLLPLWAVCISRSPPCQGAALALPNVVNDRAVRVATVSFLFGATASCQLTRMTRMTLAKHESKGPRHRTADPKRKEGRDGPSSRTKLTLLRSHETVRCFLIAHVSKSNVQSQSGSARGEAGREHEAKRLLCCLSHRS